ncbi:hypothetical protein VTI74DRAFT_2467 [Chaetomium olivicolor]
MKRTSRSPTPVSSVVNCMPDFLANTGRHPRWCRQGSGAGRTPRTSSMGARAWRAARSPCSHRPSWAGTRG